MTGNLAANLVATSRRHAQRPALLVGDAVITYGGLDDASARVAGLLIAHGLEPGERVGLMAPNVPQFAFAYYGILRAGGVVVPMHPLLKRREVAFCVADAGARLLLAWQDVAAEARVGADRAGVECVVIGPGAFEEAPGAAPPATTDIADRRPDDTAVILYTSGTTGTPKGAELTHANLALNVDVFRDLVSLDADDVVLGALPLFHAFGQTCGLNTCVAAGATLALIPRFDPALVLETVERDRVTVFEGVPTMYGALLHHPERERFDASALRVCVSGGASIAVELLRAFEAVFGCVVLEGYGLSETSPVACFNRPGAERAPGSIGTPIEGVQMRVVDDDRRAVTAGEVGEIAIRGHNVMKGYWGRPEATAKAIDADGWFYSGDLGRVDAQGRFFIVDRKKDMIIRAGYNVYPREIEEVLHEHPAVLEAAVVGIPHVALGEEVGAAVALVPGATAGPEELREFVQRQVAAYKYPRHVWIVDALPKGATGKVLKRSIELPLATREAA